MTKSSKATSLETLACDAGLAQLPFRQAHDRRTASSAGASSTRASARPASAPSIAAPCRRASSGRRSASTSASTPSSTAATRPAAGGVVAQAIGAIENALLDAKAKALGVPCYELLGGKLRDRIRVYWSHCATWRINHPTYYKPRDHRPRRRQGDRPRGAREELHRAQDQHLHLRGRQAARLAAGLRLAVLPRAQRRQERAAQPAHASGSDPRRRRPRRRPAARPQLQRQDRGLSEDPARDRRPRHVLDRDRQLQSRGARLHPPRTARIRSPRARRCSACASSCPISASRRWTSRSSTRRGTACGSR